MAARTQSIEVRCRFGCRSFGGEGCKATARHYFIVVNRGLVQFPQTSAEKVRDQNRAVIVVPHEPERGRFTTDKLTGW